MILWKRAAEPDVQHRKIIRTDPYWHGSPCHCSFPVRLCIYVLIKKYLQSRVCARPSPLIEMHAGLCRVRSGPARPADALYFSGRRASGDHTDRAHADESPRRPRCGTHRVPAAPHRPRCQGGAAGDAAPAPLQHRGLQLHRPPPPPPLSLTALPQSAEMFKLRP